MKDTIAHFLAFIAPARLRYWMAIRMFVDLDPELQVESKVERTIILAQYRRHFRA